MPLSKYVARPVTIEAIQLTKNNRKELLAFIGEGGYEEKSYDPVNIHIRAEHGIVVLEVGDWLIKGSRGEFYPCRDSTFTEKYQLAEKK